MIPTSSELSELCIDSYGVYGAVRPALAQCYSVGAQCYSVGDELPPSIVIYANFSFSSLHIEGNKHRQKK